MLVANCIICDDIRFEMGGKFSIIGIYGPDIIVQAVAPTYIPKLVFFLQLFFPKEYKCDAITFRIRMKEEVDDIVKIEIPTLPKADFSDDIANIAIRMPLQFSPFLLKGPGILEAYVDTAGESIRAARLNVQFVPPPDNLEENAG